MFEILFPNADKWINVDDMGVEEPYEFFTYVREFLGAYSLPFNRDTVKIRCAYQEVQKIIDEYQPHTKEFSVFFSRIYGIYEIVKFKDETGQKVDYNADLQMIKVLDERKAI